MGKAARLKRLRRQPGRGFAAALSDRMTKNFQKEIRNSEIWAQMVAEFGEEKAEEILKGCKAEIKPGGKF